MSRRVTFKSELKDRDLVVAALKTLGYKHEDRGGDLIGITSGPMNRATINLRTGEVEGDSDWHSKDVLGGLRQAYSEAECRRVINRQGATVESRTVAKNGDIKILVRMTG